MQIQGKKKINGAKKKKGQKLVTNWFVANSYKPDR
jgi:hypothetical protein